MEFVANCCILSVLHGFLMKEGRNSSTRNFSMTTERIVIV